MPNVQTIIDRFTDAICFVLWFGNSFFRRLEKRCAERGLNTFSAISKRVADRLNRQLENYATSPDD